jgi:hypothetical protein
LGTPGRLHSCSFVWAICLLFGNFNKSYDIAENICNYSFWEMFSCIMKQYVSEWTRRLLKPSPLADINCQETTSDWMKLKVVITFPLGDFRCEVFFLLFSFLKIGLLWPLVSFFEWELSFIMGQHQTKWNKKLSKLSLVDFNYEAFFLLLSILWNWFSLALFYNEMTFFCHETTLNWIKKKIVKTFLACWF